MHRLMTMNGQIASADKFAFEEEIIGSVNYRCDRYQPPRQLCRVAKGSTNNYSIVLHMSNPWTGRADHSGIEGARNLRKYLISNSTHDIGRQVFILVGQRKFAFSCSEIPGFTLALVLLMSSTLF